MSATASTMWQLGMRAPGFDLPNVHGSSNSLEPNSKEPLLVIFICNHCPYVKHVRNGMLDMIRDFQRKGVMVIGINSNDADAHPDDSPDKMLEGAMEYDYSFPYLYDETQEVAKAYHAACTPDFFRFDKDKKLFYRGQFKKRSAFTMSSN